MSISVPNTGLLVADISRVGWPPFLDRVEELQ